MDVYIWMSRELRYDITCSTWRRDIMPLLCSRYGALWAREELVTSAQSDCSSVYWCVLMDTCTRTVHGSTVTDVSFFTLLSLLLAVLAMVSRVLLSLSSCCLTHQPLIAASHTIYITSHVLHELTVYITYGDTPAASLLLTRILCRALRKRWRLHAHWMMRANTDIASIFASSIAMA